MGKSYFATEDTENLDPGILGALGVSVVIGLGLAVFTGRAVLLL
jgi:hypothetical protein